MVQQFYSWMCIQKKKKKIVRQKGFFNGSAGKESACNAGDTGDMGQIPGLERCSGGGYGISLQYSWAFHVVLAVKNLPANAGDTGDAGSVPGL